MEIPKAYLSQSVESKWLKHWHEKRYFHAPLNSNRPSYSIVIPPPNVTGILHMGHALNNTLQDILARYKRMQGFDVLWMPGTDHAGIATQNVVEKSLLKEGIARKSLGRERFVEKVWEWREKYGTTIVEQLKRLGCSCDWDRIRFTMDEGLSLAVKEVFVKLFDKGLIYRSHYIINWCPRCQTALSDEEVLHRQLPGKLYHLKYSVLNSNDYVVIATTRPETLLGDTAIGFHPDDDRYQHLKNKTVVLPLVGRHLKVIQDALIDPAFGTGVLKITPSHDPVDFEFGKKHHLDFVNILNPDGTLNENTGAYKGLERMVARKKIVQELRDQGILIKEEDHMHAVGHCYRCDTVVEPYTSDQWFVKMKPLSLPALGAVQDGRVNFYPERWTKVYVDWMENIRDWCISRQIWWGHRIPVYYKPDGTYTAARDEAEARRKLGVSADVPLRQDEDVLDTWFSSWLWPFTTMGWPRETPELKKYYPTHTLVTGYEIIFFWVARMLMAGFEFMGREPFKDIYIHGIVRDETGAKMSKSKGNVLDPLEVIDELGADALRFSLILITSEGQDVFASKERCEIGRNFANKIWNAFRYCMVSVQDKYDPKMPQVPFEQVDLWILSRLHRTIQDVQKALDEYHFHRSASLLYDFVWGEFCDWYLELSKAHRDSPSTRWTLIEVLKQILILLHPFMPFLTEEIWDLLHIELKLTKTSDLIVTAASRADSSRIHVELEERMALVIAEIQAIRNARAMWNVPAKERVNVTLSYADKGQYVWLKDFQVDIQHMARLENLTIGENVSRPEGSVIVSSGFVQSYLECGNSVDVEAELQKMKTEMTRLDSEIQKTQTLLQNPSFVQRAKKAVVDQEEAKLRGLFEKRQNLAKYLS